MKSLNFFVLDMCFKPKFYTKASNAKSCSKVAEHNR